VSRLVYGLWKWFCCSDLVGVLQGYRETQRQLIEMAEKTAGVDQMKGATLEQISVMVEEINREFKKKSSQLQPLMTELKGLKQEFNDLDTEYNERKNTFDKVAVGLELEKQSLEKECDDFQEECLREESRYHYLNNLITIAKIKLDRAEQEKKWQDKDSKGRMLPDFANIKELYNHKLTQQEQLIKQLRKKQKDLKENSEAMTNQKTNFNHLQALLKLKLRQGEPPSGGPSYSGGGLGPAPTAARGGVYGSREDNYESMTF
jgi:intraflagellar transport protein 81